MKLHEFIRDRYQSGERDALKLQEAAREVFPHKICGLDYVQRIMRETQRKMEAATK